MSHTKPLRPPVGRFTLGKAIRRRAVSEGIRESTKLGMCLLSSRTLRGSYPYTLMTVKWPDERNLAAMWVISKANVDLEDSSPPFDQVNLVCTQREADNEKDLIHSKIELFKIITSCDTNVCWHSFRKIVHTFIDDHQFSKDDFERVGEFELAAECAHVVLQCLYVARIGRPDIPWTGNTFARGCHGIEQGVRQKD